MHSVVPLPNTGEVFLDTRGGSRALRVSWHSEAEVVVLSLWREDTCAGTFRLSVDEVPDLIDALREGLDQAYADTRRSFLPGRSDKDRHRPTSRGATSRRTSVRDTLGIASEI